MAKDPAVLFYTNDFLSRTFTMTDEQVGKYIRLLCIQHQQEYLTEQDMLKICGSYDVVIYSKFTKEDDKYYNDRMRIETNKRRLYTESRRNNLKSTPHMVKHMDAHMEDENENTNVDLTLIVLNENEDRFFDFWNLYDKKVRKPATQKQWDKLTEAEKQKVLAVTPAYVKSKPEKQYRLDPERFLKYKSFNDEIIEAKNGTNKNNGGASPEFLRELVTKRAAKERS